MTRALNSMHMVLLQNWCHKHCMECFEMVKIHCFTAMLKNSSMNNACILHSEQFYYDFVSIVSTYPVTWCMVH